MLHEFLTSNRDELAKRCRAKVAERGAPSPSAGQQYGIPLLIGQLIDILRAEQAAGPGAAPAKLQTNIGTVAEKHGYELLRKGFTVEQVVHDYGDLCQALTELAHEKNAPISVDEFHTFNRCLDNAIADAVTEFGRARDLVMSGTGAQTMNDRLGSLADELRNHVDTAALAFDAMRNGSVGLSGSTGGVLARSLDGLRAMVDRSIAELRLTTGLQPRPESISLVDLLHEVRIPSVIEAKARGIQLSTVVPPGLMVAADRQMLWSALANLLQSAVQATRANGRVELTAHAEGDRVLIEIKDECGGLPPSTTDDQTSVGLGLAISRRSIEANGGKLTVRDLPGAGCISTIDLPQSTAAN